MRRGRKGTKKKNSKDEGEERRTDRSWYLRENPGREGAPLHHIHLLVKRKKKKEKKTGPRQPGRERKGGKVGAPTRPDKWGEKAELL